MRKHPPLPHPAGSDYVFLSTTLTFSGEDLRQCVEIDLIDDDIGEGFESFRVSLQSNDLPVFRSVATVSIVQDVQGIYVTTMMQSVLLMFAMYYRWTGGCDSERAYYCCG